MSYANEILPHFPFKNLYHIGLQIPQGWKTQTAPMSDWKAGDITGSVVFRRNARMKKEREISEDEMWSLS